MRVLESIPRTPFFVIRPSGPAGELGPGEPPHESPSQAAQRHAHAVPRRSARLRRLPMGRLLDPHWVTADAQAAIRAYRDANVHIYSTDAPGVEWTAPGADAARHFDFAPVGERLQTGAGRRPRGALHPAHHVRDPYLVDNWWNAATPMRWRSCRDGVRSSASFASQGLAGRGQEFAAGLHRPPARGRPVRPRHRLPDLHRHVRRVDQGLVVAWAWPRRLQRAHAARLPRLAARRSTATRRRAAGRLGRPDVTLDTRRRALRRRAGHTPATTCSATRSRERKTHRLLRSATPRRPPTPCSISAGSCKEETQRRKADRRVLWLPDGPGLERQLLHRRPRQHRAASEVTTVQRSGHLGLAQGCCARPTSTSWSAPTATPSAAWAATACPCSRPKSLRAPRQAVPVRRRHADAQQLRPGQAHAPRVEHPSPSTSATSPRSSPTGLASNW